MACCEGEKNAMEDVTPPEIQKLRKQQATIASDKLSSGATASPYGGPLSAGADPLTLMASNMMTGLAGYNPYQSPMQGGMPGGGGGGGIPPASWAGTYTSIPRGAYAQSRYGGGGSSGEPGTGPGTGPGGGPGMPPRSRMPPREKRWDTPY